MNSYHLNLPLLQHTRYCLTYLHERLTGEHWVWKERGGGGFELRTEWKESHVDCMIWKSLSPACNSRYEKTWESYKILVVNKSGVTCVFLFFCFLFHLMIHVKCVDNFWQRLTDCLKIGLERSVLFTPWQPWGKSEAEIFLPITFRVRQKCVFWFPLWQAMTERLLLIFRGAFCAGPVRTEGCHWWEWFVWCPVHFFTMLQLYNYDTCVYFLSQ